MGEYLIEAPQDEAMAAWGHEGPSPLVHTVYTHDFMCMARHDIACPVCFFAHAVISRDLTPGQYRQTVHPCRVCEEQGWRIARLPRFIRWLLRIDQ